MDFDPEQCLALAKRAFYDYHHSDIDPIPCLDCARLASEFAAQRAPSASVRLTALISWSRAYMFLADADTSFCVQHAQNSVATAERAVAFFSETSPSDLMAKARVYDQLGCALRQQYVYLANEDDCRQSIEAHRTSLALTPESATNSVKASRRYHLATALYMLSRGLFSISASAASQRYILEANRINGEANNLVANSKVSYALMHSNLLLLAARKVIGSVDVWARTEAATLEQKLAQLTVQTQDNDPYQRISTQFGDMDFDSLIQHVTLVHDYVAQLAETRHMHTAAYLGQLSARLVGMRSLDDAKKLDLQGSEIMSFLSRESAGLNLCHVVHLMDILEAAVDLKENLKLHVPGLIEQVASCLDAIIPSSHMERPQLHYLLGSSLCDDQSALVAHGSHAPFYGPAIEQHRKALQLTPDGHPSQAKFLLGLIRTLWFSAWPGSMSQSNVIAVHQEIRCWSEVLDLLDQDLGFQAGFSSGPAAISRLLSLNEGSRRIDPDQALDAFSSIEGIVQVSLSAACTSTIHREGLAKLAHMMLTIAKNLPRNDEMWQVSYKYLREALQLWQYLQTCKQDVALSQNAIEFGLGSTLAAQGELELASGNFEDAYRLLTDGITHMKEACSLENLTTQSEIEDLAALANAYARRHIPSLGIYSNIDDLEAAVHIFRQACAAVISLAMPAKVLYDICKDWMGYAAVFEHESLLESYDVLIGSVARLAWIGVDVQTRYERLQDIRPTLTADAAVHACIQALPLRNRYAELRAVHPELVSELENLGREIEARSFGQGRTTYELQNESAASADQIDREAYELRRLGEDWDRLVARVRSFEGYEHFLQTAPVAQLCLAASNGPVVLIVTSSQHEACFAIAILGLSVDSIQSLRLSATPDQVEVMSQQFTHALSNKLKSMRFHEPAEERGVKTARSKPQRPENVAQEILSQLWHLVMKPIVELVNSYSKSRSTSLPQIWLSATGALSSLPLHAAGVYNEDGTTAHSECVLDHVVCSYTPSLSALLREPPSDTSCSKVYAFAGGEGLYQTSTEAEVVKSICDKKAIVNLIPCRTTSSSRIREALREAHVAHFACHGVQDLGNPLKSRLSFSRTCEIDLEDLMQDIYPNASLAVLFACQTAQGDQELTEESLHIAGTMLFAGFRGAIGNLWEMADQDGPRLCSDFYHSLLEGDDDTIQYKNAGRALHQAVCNLKKTKASIFRWATFIHIGQ